MRYFFIFEIKTLKVLVFYCYKFSKGRSFNMDIVSIIYCKTSGAPFRIKRLCFLNSIKHFELENVAKQSNRKLLAENSIKADFEINKRKTKKSRIARFTELISG